MLLNFAVSYWSRRKVLYFVVGQCAMVDEILIKYLYFLNLSFRSPLNAI